MEKSQQKEEKRKAYQKPQIVSQEIYETMALICGKCTSGSDPTGHCGSSKTFAS